MAVERVTPQRTAIKKWRISSLSWTPHCICQTPPPDHTHLMRVSHSRGKGSLREEGVSDRVREEGVSDCVREEGVSDCVREEG